MAEINITNNFNAPVGANVNHADSVEIKLDKDGTMQVKVNGKDVAPETNRRLTDDELRDRINLMLPKMQGKGNKRKWFCIVKVLMIHGLLPYGDFTKAEELLQRLYPQGLSPEYDVAEMNRMHIGSFTLPIEEWTMADGPVKRTAEFMQYQNLAKEFDQLFE